MKKRVLLCALAVGMLTALPMTTQAYDISELQVNIWDNNQLAGLQEIADEWSEQSGVKVTINVVDWDNYWTLLEAGASGGQMPDVFWMHSNTAQMYMENDLILPLDDYIAADDAIDLENYYEGIVDLYKSGGVQYALPKDHDTIALLYNKALFDKYGVEYPNDDWSWDDVLAAATAISEGGKDDGVYGYALNTSNNQDGWYNLVYDYGAQIITDDHKGTTIGSAEGKAGMEMVRKLLEVAAPQTTVAETGTDSLFQSGLVGMITQGSWMINSFYKAENSSDYAWDPDAAYDLISWFCRKENQVKQAELGVTMAGMKGVSEEFASAFPGMDVSAFTRAEEDANLYFRPYTRNTTVWEDALQQSGGFLEPWQNPTDPDLMAAACDAAQGIIEQAIANE